MDKNFEINHLTFQEMLRMFFELSGDLTTVEKEKIKEMIKNHFLCDSTILRILDLST